MYVEEDGLMYMSTNFKLIYGKWPSFTLSKVKKLPLFHATSGFPVLSFRILVDSCLLKVFLIHFSRF